MNTGIGLINDKVKEESVFIASRKACWTLESGTL